VGRIGHTAHQGEFGFKFQVQHVQDLHGFSDDFGPDAVARKDCDFHGQFFCRLNSSLARFKSLPIDPSARLFKKALFTRF
jgi:hypothetical protein